MTLPQAKCNLWFKERFKRITTTKALQFFNAFKRHLDEEGLLDLFLGRKKKPKKKGTIPALDYGNDYEDFARTKYCKKTGNTVVQLGMVVKDKFAWLSGSPDGMIIKKGDDKDDPQTYGLLEIKCLYRLETIYDSNISNIVKCS